MRLFSALLVTVWATAAQADKADDLWNGGAASGTARDQLNRALWLYELGDTTRADVLLSDWVGRMPDTAPLPDGFADLAAAPDIAARILTQHLIRGDRKALPVLQLWLDRDLIQGWMVYAELSDHFSTGPGQPMVSGLNLGPNTAARLADGRRANRALHCPLALTRCGQAQP